MDDRLWEDYLFHHGIQGQKWGVRNGPPYPLSKENKSNEEKAGSATLVAYAATTGILIATSLISSAINKYRNKKQKDNAKKKLEKKNTDMLKKDGPVETLDELKKKKTIGTPENDMSKVNLSHDGEIQGTTKNCSNCTLAFEMRRRGYDVRARRLDHGDVTMNEIASKYFVGAKNVSKGFNDVKYDPETYGSEVYKRVTKELKTGSGNNSRGIIYVSWMNGGAHVVNYEVKDNKVNIYDAQSNKKITQNTFSFVYAGIDYIRTDNVDVKPQITERICSIGNEKRDNK